MYVLGLCKICWTGNGDLVTQLNSLILPTIMNFLYQQMQHSDHSDREGESGT